MPNDVTYQRPEYAAAMQWRWPMVRDVCAGSERIKARGDQYLPRPNPDDKSRENLARYKSYVQRAVFYNATGRTRDGLIGAVYRNAPTLEVPGLLDYVKTDVDGQGNSIYQQSQRLISDVLETGRTFLLADYPATLGTVSRADQQSGRVRSTIAAYTAESVVNWRTERIGAEQRLALVVICEIHEEPAEFGIQCIEQYRVLRLIDGQYVVEIWREIKLDNGLTEWVVFDTYQPLRSNGQPWDRIPGSFVGAQNNDISIDEAPLYDLAELNLGHYRNSADYEDACFLVGQPQVWVMGLDDERWLRIWKDEGIYLGSRAIGAGPAGATVQMLQAAPNSMAREAMDAKKADMASLGARLIQQGQGAVTATQERNENAAEHSVLSLVAANVSEAYTTILGYMAEFEGATGGIEFSLNQDFLEASLDAQMLTALVAAWQAGALTQSALFRLLRKFDLVDPEQTDDELLEELDSSPRGLALDVKEPINEPAA